MQNSLPQNDGARRRQNEPGTLRRGFAILVSRSLSLIVAVMFGCVSGGVAGVMAGPEGALVGAGVGTLAGVLAGIALAFEQEEKRLTDERLDRGKVYCPDDEHADESAGATESGPVEDVEIDVAIGNAPPEHAPRFGAIPSGLV